LTEKSLEAELRDFAEQDKDKYIVFIDEVKLTPPPNPSVIVSGGITYMSVFVPLEQLHSLQDNVEELVKDYFQTTPNPEKRTGTIHASTEFRPGHTATVSASKVFLPALAKVSVQHECRFMHFTLFKQHLQPGQMYNVLRNFELKDTDTGEFLFDLKNIEHAALFLLVHGIERLAPEKLGGSPSLFILADRGVSDFKFDHKSGISYSKDWTIQGLSQHIFNGGVHFTDRRQQTLLVLPDVSAYAFAWFRKSFGALENEPDKVINHAFSANLDGHASALFKFLRIVAPVMFPLKREEFLEFDPSPPDIHS
jgi:hypothetical protein